MCPTHLWMLRAAAGWDFEGCGDVECCPNSDESRPNSPISNSSMAGEPGAAAHNVVAMLLKLPPASQSQICGLL